MTWNPIKNIKPMIKEMKDIYIYAEEDAPTNPTEPRVQPVQMNVCC